MTKKQRADLAVSALQKEYPDAICTLDYDEPYQLLFATRLAAQCTDLRVNKVTKVLFESYPTLESIASAEVDEIEAIVRPCGLGKTKARDLVAAANMLISDYDSQVPNTIDELTKIPGIGRKTANVVMAEVFHLPAIIVDTHCIRLTNLLGLTASKNPEVVEKELDKILSPNDSANFCHRLVHHGRAVCVARRPDCKNCCMNGFCKYALNLKI